MGDRAMLDRVLIFFLALSIILSAVATNVTLTSSPELPNFAEGDNITLWCKSTNASVQINWLINNTSASAENFTSLGVATTGSGTNASSLTVPGQMAFNNAIVKCVAFIFADNATKEFSPDPVLLGIQGRLESVNLLVAKSNDSCCYCLNWVPPFTLPGVPILGYNIYVANNDGAILHTDTHTATEWEYSYCPKEYGDYKFSVAAVNTVGEGHMGTVAVEVKEEPLVEAQVIKKDLEDEEWKVLIEISTSQPHECVSIVLLESDADNISVNANNFNDSIDGRLVAEFIMPNNKNIDDMTKNFIVSIFYTNSMKSKSSSIVIGFFDVVDYSMSIDGDKINIRCIFATGSRAKGCFIKLIEVLSSREYQLNITGVDISEPIQLVPARQYFLLVYDINSDSSISSSPALTEQFGMPPVRNSTNSLPKPTLEPKPHSSTIIIGVVPCGTIALIVIVLIVAIITIIIAKQCRKKCKRESCLPTYDEPQRDRNVFTHRNGTNNLPVHGHSCRSTMQQKLQWFKMLVDRLQRRS